MRLEFFTDPADFLAVAGDLLSADPVLGTVIAGVSDRTARELADGTDSWSEVGAPFAQWWLVVRDESGAVISAAMRTAPFKPYPVFCLPMPEEAARALAAALHERGEFLGGVNGALPAAEVIAAETAGLAGGKAAVHTRVRLWEATEVIVPPAPRGRLRLATEDDAPRVLEWFTAFHVEADEQAGREPDPASGEHNTMESVLVRIREGAEWLWERPDGEVVHLTGRSLPSYGVSRIGPVFTSREHRGAGIASYVVAELTRTGLEAGHRMCLFTDQANPTSNKVYEALGYRPVVDMAHLVIE
jgi:GNAT superfamily N-acetyltransferase